MRKDQYDLLKSIGGIRIAFESDCGEVLRRLEADFDGFAAAPSGTAPDFRIVAELKSKPADMPGPSAPYRQSRNCLILDDGAIRWNDYAGQAWVRADFGSNSARVTSENVERLHEISYLIALSRAGKALDSRGLHRLHAMGVALGDRVLLLSMPMKGGKTTLFLRMLDQEPALNFVSDDSPLIDVSGRVHAFPLRIGLDSEGARSHSGLSWINWTRAYSLDRMRYGQKVLVPSSAFSRSKFEFSGAQSVVFVHGLRGSEFRLVRASTISLLPVLLKNLVIGIGLPMMREYFLENRPRDFGRCVKISLLRLRAAAALLRKSEKYRVYLGPNHEANAQALLQLVRGGEGREVDSCHASRS